MHESEADGLPMAEDTERELLSGLSGGLGSAGAPRCRGWTPIAIRSWNCWSAGRRGTRGGEDPPPEALCGDALALAAGAAGADRQAEEVARDPGDAGVARGR